MIIIWIIVFVGKINKIISDYVRYFIKSNILLNLGLNFYRNLKVYINFKVKFFNEWKNNKCCML